MNIKRLLISIGVLIVVLPFLGFPNSWDTFLFVLLGLFIIGLSFSIKETKHKNSLPEHNTASSFVEHNPDDTPLPSTKRRKVRRIHPVKEIKEESINISAEI